MSADRDAGVGVDLAWVAQRLERLAAAGKCTAVAPVLVRVAGEVRELAGRPAAPGRPDPQDVSRRLDAVARDLAAVEVPCDYLTVVEQLVALIATAAHEALTGGGDRRPPSS